MDSCQCTDFVYTYRPDIPPGMGHAKEWLHAARLHRFPYDQIPQVGDVAVILNGAFGFSAEYGHVAIVIAVSPARGRFSIAGWDGLKGDCQVQIYRDLPVTRDTYFIHFKDLSQRPWWLQPGWRGEPLQAAAQSRIQPR